MPTVRRTRYEVHDTDDPDTKLVEALYEQGGGGPRIWAQVKASPTMVADPEVLAWVLGNLDEDAQWTAENPG